MPSYFLKRIFILLSGLTLLAFGVALSIRSSLGTSPISSLPYVYSYFIPLTIGTLTIFLHIIFILLQMLILGKDFQWIQWLQLIVGIVFGFMIDCMLWLTQSLHAENYTFQLLLCLAGCLLTAIGVIFQVKAKLIFLAGEGLYLAYASRFNVSYGTCKTYGDIILVTIAAISSYIALNEIVGIREGTIISAFLIGTLVKTLIAKFNFLDFKAQL